jgi:hypothetical protein
MSLTSSSSSLRRQPLGEISEDAEESPHVRGQSKSKVSATPAPPLKDIVKEAQKEPISITVVEPVFEKAQPLPTTQTQEVAPHPAEQDAYPVRSSSASTPRAAASTPTPTIRQAPEKTLPSTPDPTPPNTSDGRSTTAPLPDGVPELPPIQHLSNAYQIEETDPRDSFQSARPSVIDAGRASYSNYDSYDPYKPKVKRGPRPHVEAETRPQTAGSTKKPQSQRLVANLPTSVRTQNRSAAANTGRPGSQQSSRSVPSKFAHYSEPIEAPPLPSPNHISSLFLPQTQRDRTYSKAGSIASTATAAATPEKLRLMKALQLRKRNQMQARRESEKPMLDEGPRANIQSQIEADLEAIGPPTGRMSSRADSTSATRVEEASKAASAARMASPTSITNVSEAPSTQSSSFVEDNDGATSHASISSDTSSSVTPKADTRETQQRKQEQIAISVAARPIADAALAPVRHVLSAADNPSGPQEKQVIGSHSDISSTAPFVSTEAQRPVFPDQPNAPNGSADPLKAAQSVLNDVPRAPEASRMEEEKLPPVPNKLMDAQFRRRRGPNLEPIKVVSSPDLSEASDDDSFMEELQHAQVQQAKPVAVGRSPVTPIYHNLSNSVDRSKEIGRTVSSPLHGMTTSGSTSPVQSRPRSVRSISTALPSWPPSNENIPPVPLARKGPLSSGISKRIKALEVFTSGRDSTSSPPHAPPNNVSVPKPNAPLTSARKRLSFIPGGNAPNASSRNPPASFPPTSGPTYENEATDYERSKPLVQRPNSAVESYQPQHKGETISVTARIVRSSNTIPEDISTTGDQQAPLQRSKLTIEHERAESREDRPSMTRDMSAFSIESSAKSPQTERGRPSFSSYRSDSQTPLPTSDSMASRLSMVSGKKKDKTIPRSNSDNSSFTEEKSKQSRTRRLMQRVSNLSTNSRRNIAGAFSNNSREQITSDRITEQVEPDHDRDHDLASVPESVSHVVDIGDVNVQFPDTLLWKRRFLRIDDQGYLIFTPPTMERNTRNISRKFHLSEFKKPTLPDVEREEMAWSILLDLEDGSCIQCACESKYTQTQVLRSKYRYLCSTTEVTNCLLSARGCALGVSPIVQFSLKEMQRTQAERSKQETTHILDIIILRHCN